MIEAIVVFVFMVLISGVAGHVAHKHDTYLRKRRAYLGLREANFFTWRLLSIKAVSLLVIAAGVYIAYLYMRDEKQGLPFFWKVFFLYSFSVCYLIYDQYSHYFKKNFSVIKWLWVGISGVTGTIASFWVWERVSNITGLPQGELAASELCLFTIQFFIVLTFIFMLLNYISISYVYVRILWKSDVTLRTLAVFTCLIYITALGPLLYGKTLVDDEVNKFVKGVIVFASYTSDTSKCDEIEGLVEGSNVLIAFIKGGDISIAKEVRGGENEYSDYTFTKRKCKLPLPEKVTNSGNI